METPVNGGRNSDGPKVNMKNFHAHFASLSKTKLYAGNSSYPPSFGGGSCTQPLNT